MDLEEKAVMRLIVCLKCGKLKGKYQNGKTAQMFLSGGQTRSTIHCKLSLKM